MTFAQALARLSDMFGNPGIPFANRNYFVDGNFDQWINTSLPVAASVFSNGAATMYYGGPGAGGAVTLNRLVAGPGSEPLGMTSPVYNVFGFNQTTASTGTVAAGTAPAMWQYVESARTLSGRSATFSIWLVLVSGGPVTIPSIICRQFFGSGGSPSAQVIADKAVNWVLTNQWQKFSVRLDIPSVLNKTLGSNNNDNLQVGFWFPPGVVANIYTTQWQLEQSNPNSSSDINGKGGAATVFEYRGQQAELARAQRYYQTIFAGASQAVALYNATSTNAGYGYAAFPAGTMRGTPAVSTSSPLSTIGYGGTTGAVALAPVGPNFIQFAVTGITSIAGYTGLVAGGASNSIIALDARL